MSKYDLYGIELIIFKCNFLFDVLQMLKNSTNRTHKTKTSRRHENYSPKIISLYCEMCNFIQGVQCSIYCTRHTGKLSNLFDI